MTKLTPSNISSIAAIPNGSIIKKVDDNNFAEVTASDITDLWWWININHISTYSTLNSSQAPNWTNTSSAYNPTNNQFIMVSMSINCNSAWWVTRTRLQKSTDWISWWTDVYMIEIIESISWPWSRNLEMWFMLSKDLYYRSQSEQTFTWWAAFTVLTATEI